MNTVHLHSFLVLVQHGISLCGVLVILIGVAIALWRFIVYAISSQKGTPACNINQIRLNLGRVLTLGLEFIVAADLINTTTAPDYYTVGIVAIIVLIRTFLSYTLNREINDLRSIENTK